MITLLWIIAIAIVLYIVACFLIAFVDDIVIEIKRRKKDGRNDKSLRENKG